MLGIIFGGPRDELCPGKKYRFCHWSLVCDQNLKPINHPLIIIWWNNQLYETLRCQLHSYKVNGTGFGVMKFWPKTSREMKFWFPRKNQVLLGYWPKIDFWQIFDIFYIFIFWPKNHIPVLYRAWRSSDNTSTHLCKSCMHDMARSLNKTSIL